MSYVTPFVPQHYQLAETVEEKNAAARRQAALNAQQLGAQMSIAKMNNQTRLSEDAAQNQLAQNAQDIQGYQVGQQGAVAEQQGQLAQNDQALKAQSLEDARKQQAFENGLAVQNQGMAQQRLGMAQQAQQGELQGQQLNNQSLLLKNKLAELQSQNQTQAQAFTNIANTLSGNGPGDGPTDITKHMNDLEAVAPGSTAGFKKAVANYGPNGVTISGVDKDDNQVPIFNNILYQAITDHSSIAPIKVQTAAQHALIYDDNGLAIGNAVYSNGKWQNLNDVLAANKGDSKPNIMNQAKAAASNIPQQPIGKRRFDQAVVNNLRQQKQQQPANVGMGGMSQTGGTPPDNTMNQAGTRLGGGVSSAAQQLQPNLYQQPMDNSQGLGYYSDSSD